MSENSLAADQVRRIVEAALLCADEPLSVEQLAKLFRRGETHRDTIREALEQLEVDCAERGCELKRVASGFRYQVRQGLSPWVSRLWEERPPRYSRALLETLALIVYKQPVTRGEIEEVRGVAVSSNIIRTLLEREWVRVVGYREVPGRPAMFGTTREFLDYFNMKSLNEMPPLAEIRALIEPALEQSYDGAAGMADVSVPVVLEADTDSEAAGTEPTVELSGGGAEIVPLPTVDKRP